jgi:hypothetical protein
MGTSLARQELKQRRQEKQRHHDHVDSQNITDGFFGYPQPFVSLIIGLRPEIGQTQIDPRATRQRIRFSSDPSVSSVDEYLRPIVYPPHAIILHKD